MSKKEGQYSLLLDENFDIIWQSESLTAILGFGDICGRNCTEFVHPDDLEIALANMFQINERLETNSISDARYTPESAEIRVVDVEGVWRPFKTTTYNYLDDPNVAAVLCTCEITRDRSDVGRAIELLGGGADVDAVLPVVARLADRSLGGDARSSLAWRDTNGTSIVTAIDEPALDRRLADAANLIWSLGLTEPLVITDLHDCRLRGAGAIAAEAGFRALFLVPIEAPTGPEIIGAMAAWGTTSLEFVIAPQYPIHVALRLAALSIADRIIEAIGAPIHTNGLQLHVGASVGVAVGAQPLIPALLVQQADKALYDAKNSGKNTVRLSA